MKKLLALLFGLSVSVCFTQNTWKLREDQLITLKEGFIYVQEYADSLNSFECNNCKVLPDFFYNYNFDRENSYRVSKGLHSSPSIRKLIIDKINNEPLLKAVIASKDRRLKKRHKIPKGRVKGRFLNYYIITPFQEYSTYKLVEFRLEELMNERDIGKGASNYPD